MQMKYIQFTLSKSTIFVVLTYLILHSVNAAYAAKPIYVGGKERAAVRGYDVVSYFTENKPVKGSKEFSLTYKGAKWLFSSANNKALFEADSEKYAPQYGGYCAYAVSRNTTASVKPEYFTIHDDKLYLNYSKSVNKKWIKDKGGYIKKANKNWPKVLEK